MRDEFGASVRRDTIPVLMPPPKESSRCALPDEGGDGRVLKVLGNKRPAAAGRAAVRRQQKLIARQSFSTPGPTANRSRQTKCFLTTQRDRRPGAFRAECAAAEVILSRTLTNVSLNTPVDDALFAKPQ